MESIEIKGTLVGIGSGNRAKKGSNMEDLKEAGVTETIHTNRNMIKPYGRTFTSFGSVGHSISKIH